eukprot:5908521-Pyramimonas_sp.AAC.1
MRASVPRDDRVNRARLTTEKKVTPTDGNAIVKINGIKMAMSSCEHDCMAFAGAVAAYYQFWRAEGFRQHP